MIERIAEAQGEIAGAAARDLSWFAPPERKQFLGGSILLAFASLLLSAFLTGFVEASRKKAKKAGEEVAEYLWEAISDLFSDKHESEAKNGLEMRAADASRIAAGMSQERVTALLVEVEKALKSALQEKLPAEQAGKLASSVSQSALNHILSTPPKSK